MIPMEHIRNESSPALHSNHLRKNWNVFHGRVDHGTAMMNRMRLPRDWHLSVRGKASSWKTFYVFFRECATYSFSSLFLWSSFYCEVSYYSSFKNFDEWNLNLTLWDVSTIGESWVKMKLNVEYIRGSFLVKQTQFNQKFIWGTGNNVIIKTHL